MDADRKKDILAWFKSLLKNDSSLSIKTWCFYYAWTLIDFEELTEGQAEKKVLVSRSMGQDLPSWEDSWTTSSKHDAINSGKINSSSDMTRRFTSWAKSSKS